MKPQSQVNKGITKVNFPNKMKGVVEASCDTAASRLCCEASQGSRQESVQEGRLICSRSAATNRGESRLARGSRSPKKIKRAILTMPLRFEHSRGAC